jgi:2-polyprenyl-6-methoxyphenol hydroxylase-like FAD-dependent oxidoreductase
LQQLAGLNRDLPGADREDVDYIMWAYVARRSGDFSTADGLRGQALRDRVEQRISPWHPDLQRLIADSDEGTIEQFDFRAAVRIRPWQSTNITLLGDAVHAMPPVGGMAATSRSLTQASSAGR